MIRGPFRAGLVDSARFLQGKATGTHIHPVPILCGVLCMAILMHPQILFLVCVEENRNELLGRFRLESLNFSAQDVTQTRLIKEEEGV